MPLVGSQKLFLAEGGLEERGGVDGVGNEGDWDQLQPKPPEDIIYMLKPPLFIVAYPCYYCFNKLGFGD